ncbi:acid-sensing ion channel 1-like [Watersipora subatra]|uniref:acid-sensing ion channel 1-like n=1 Tax=Watersipora subatra TaxID=2589382 RepID=UPI00355C0A27
MSLDLGSSGIFEIIQDLYNGDRPIPPPAGKLLVVACPHPFSLFFPRASCRSLGFLSQSPRFAFGSPSFNRGSGRSRPLTGSVLQPYNISDPLYTSALQINSSQLETFFQKAAHPLNETFIMCNIFSKNYSCQDVFEVVATDAGFCFQFNSNGSLNSTAPGKSGGISVILDANVNEYSTGPTSHSEGFTTQRYPPPADNGRAKCLDTKAIPNSLKFYRQYSYSGCMVECRAKYVIDRCGCRDFLQPDNFASDENGIRACDCPDTCLDNEFIPKVSTYKFPSSNFIKEGYMDEELTDHLATNVVVVDIFYGKLSYQRLEEELAYSMFDMIANLGGTLGLCIGASALTVCEFCEFGIKLVSLYLCKKPKKNNGIIIKVAPVEDLSNN